MPAEALALVAAGLLLGTSGNRACHIGLPALACAALAALVGGRVVTDIAATPLLLAAAVIAAGAVVAALALPSAAAAAVAAGGGFAVGLDAQPEATAPGAAVLAIGATTVGATVLAAVVAVLVLNREQRWQRIGVRIAASWICAVSILYAAWLLKPATV